VGLSCVKPLGSSDQVTIWESVRECHPLARRPSGSSTTSRTPLTTISPNLWAKLTQETVINTSPIPYTIVHATQFFEFVDKIADDATHRDTIHLSEALIQPMAAEDVAAAVARAATGTPANKIVEVGGPEQFRLDTLVRRVLGAKGDPREVLTDPQARYFGAPLAERTLVPGPDATLGEIRLDDWLRETTAGPAASAAR
jgi:uncharacterized protein YbjT (DUF2867 family)